MVITQKITLDLAIRGITTRIAAKQGDANSRAVEITLLNNGQSWAVPEGTTAAVRYRKADGTAGLYDTMPDGTTPAVTYTGNVLTVNLAPQMLSYPGDVHGDVLLTCGAALLATFDFIIEVSRNPVSGSTLESQDYYKVASLEQINAAIAAAQTAASNADQSAAAAFASEQAALQAAQTASASQSAAETASTATTQAAATAQAAAETIKASAEQISKNASDIASDAPGIIETAAGETVTLTDCSDRPLRGLTIYGKTTQDGTPTPDAPVELVSVVNSGSISINLTDGADSIQSIIIPTPNGLPGIPVASGGNYTDADGQQWTCDEVDLARGVYVHRVDRAQISVIESASTISSKYIKFLNAIPRKPLIRSDDITVISDKFSSFVGSYSDLGNITTYCINTYITTAGAFRVAFCFDESVKTLDDAKAAIGDGFEVIYILDSPYETALDAEIIAAYAALHTNKPNTTIYNDSGAYTAVQYVADTDTYIRNKSIQDAEMSLTEEQKTLARSNIGAASTEDINKLAAENAELNRDLAELESIVFPEEDISALFRFTEGGGIAVNNYLFNTGDVATPSAVFCYTNEYIDVSQYIGYEMTITVPVYTASSGNAPQFGICVYDKSLNVIDAIQIEKGERSVKKISFTVPPDAKSIRTTFMITELGQGLFSCVVESNVNGLLKKNYSDGDIHFSVNANSYDGTSVETDCVLRLPFSYSRNGEKTPVIMIGHGSKGMVSDSEWYNSSADFDSFVQFLCDNGFAVFDVDNVDKNHVSTEDCLEYGCPQLLNAYHKAFEWIKCRYNVEDKLCIYGMSQGSFVAWNYPMFYRGDVKGCLISGVRVGLEWLWNIYGNIELAKKFGYNSPEYSQEYLKPFDIYTHIVSNVLTTPYVPCALFYGGDDTTGLTQNKEFENALRNSGYYAESHTYEGIDHHGITQPTNEIIRTDMLRYFKMFS